MISRDSEALILRAVDAAVAQGVVDTIKSLELVVFLSRHPDTNEPALLIGFGETLEPFLPDVYLPLAKVLSDGDIDASEAMPAIEAALDLAGYDKDYHARNQQALAES